MSPPLPQLYCSNPTCSAPLNAIGRTVCAACQTPLTYRYLWAVEPTATPASTQVAGRYWVIAPPVWLDTQPGLPPDVPVEWSDEVLPYLHLYPQRLHLPEVYGFVLSEDAAAPPAALLLENVPLDATGGLYPTIAQAWSSAPPTRQAYWLWQLLQLWPLLQEQGVAASLLAAENIRVEGWRVRLCQLYEDVAVLPIAPTPPEAALTLADLAHHWLKWIEQSSPPLRDALADLCQQMRTGAAWSAIAAQLNQLLLEQAAQLPLALRIAGATDTGPERSHNEDTCYPLTPAAPDDPDAHLGAHLGIVCDGIGGHEGGEVASQLAVRSLKLQVQALLTEVSQQPAPVLPDLLAQQLAASVRIANNLIASQNDQQGREDRRRMGTTLVMALLVPQRIAAVPPTPALPGHGHELYLVNVGDSRAYWLTERYCHLLTVDDDVAAREVRLGRSLYREALLRPDAGALTQALGTRDAEFLRPSVQRFILEEDGLLLLCSDGLSDNGLVEEFWQDYTDPVLQGARSLDAATRAWIDLANQKNGYDNTSVVLLDCRLSPRPVLPPPVAEAATSRAPDWSPASQALLAEADVALPEAATSIERSSRWLWIGGLLLLLLLGGWALWRTQQPLSQPATQPTLRSPSPQIR